MAPPDDEIADRTADRGGQTGRTGQPGPSDKAARPQPPPDPLTTTPSEITQAGPRQLAITWGDGEKSLYDVRILRLSCGCASCVDEWTGEDRLDPDSVPEDVHPLRIDPVGRYAIQIYWSDGHDTGIYPFARLRELAATMNSDGSTS